MLGQTHSTPDQFVAQMRAFYDKLSLTDALGRIRAKAWEHFIRLGLPDRHTEVYRYVRLRQLLSQTLVQPNISSVTTAQLKSHLLPESQESVIVFVNGIYSSHLSNTRSLPSKVVVADLSQAMTPYGAFLNNQWNQGLKEETDPFAALNAALHMGGLFLYIPPKCVVEAPIHILNIVQGDQLLILPRLHLVAGAESQVTLVTSSAELQSHGYLINQTADLTLEENAHVKFVQLAQALSADVWQFDALRAHLKRHSQLKTVSITDGAATVRHDYRIALAGEGCEASLNGAWMLDEKREAHVNVLIDHQAPACRSHQLFKGALTDSSRSSFEGKILVRRPAQKTEAYQLNQNLLLSDRANADSKPNLEVFADDVKASHGATVGQLDAEHLFYLKARGLSDTEARNLLLHGFAKEVIDLIPVKSLKEKLHQYLECYLA